MTLSSAKWQWMSKRSFNGSFQSFVYTTECVRIVSEYRVHVYTNQLVLPLINEQHDNTNNNNNSIYRIVIIVIIVTILIIIHST